MNLVGWWVLLSYLVLLRWLWAPRCRLLWCKLWNLPILSLSDPSAADLCQMLCRRLGYRLQGSVRWRLRLGNDAQMIMKLTQTHRACFILPMQSYTESPGESSESVLSVQLPPPAEAIKSAAIMEELWSLKWRAELELIWSQKLIVNLTGYSFTLSDWSVHSWLNSNDYCVCNSTQWF